MLNGWPQKASLIVYDGGGESNSGKLASVDLVCISECDLSPDTRPARFDKSRRGNTTDHTRWDGQNTEKSGVLCCRELDH